MSWGSPLAETDETELERLKKAFALAWLHTPSEPYKAALRVFHIHTGKALWVADNWLTDPVVMEEKERLLNEHGSLHFLPDKTQVAREVYDLAQSSKSTSEKLASYKLYSDIMGFVEPKTFTNNGIIQNNQGAKVMVIKDHGSNQEWEDKAKAHQTALRKQALQDIDAQ